MAAKLFIGSPSLQTTELITSITNAKANQPRGFGFVPQNSHEPSGNPWRAEELGR